MPSPTRPDGPRSTVTPRSARASSHDATPARRADGLRCAARAAAALAAIAGLALASAAQAQHVELTGFGGVQYGGSTDVLGGTASLDAGPAYGGMAYYRVRDDGLFGVSYSREQTSLTSTMIGPGGPVLNTMDVAVGVLHAGGELEISPKKALTPILGLSVGATHFTPRSGGSTEWFFSAALTGGLKYRITKHIGLRAHMRLIATVINDASTIACSSNGGLTCAIAADLDGLVQGDLVGGLYVAF